jgi:hypothetical protein
LRAHLPWLGQGDIFGDAPVLEIALQEDDEVTARILRGPAVLLTHDCAMDKPDREGRPRAERLQFARLRSMQTLPADRRRTLAGQARQVQPLEALYLGQVRDLGESFLLLSDPYFLPAAYFGLYFEDYGQHPDGGADSGSYVTAGRNDSRIGRTDEEQLHLLRLKMLAFWTRLEPKEI